MMILSQGYFTHSFTYVSGNIATRGDVGMQVVIMVETPHWDVSTYLRRDIVVGVKHPASTQAGCFALTHMAGWRYWVSPCTRVVGNAYPPKPNLFLPAHPVALQVGPVEVGLNPIKIDCFNCWIF